MIHSVEKSDKTLFLLNFAGKDKSSNILSTLYSKKLLQVQACGSSKQIINGSYKITDPYFTVEPWNNNYDWCSTCMKSYSEHPWIMFSVKDSRMVVDSYTIRTGCAGSNLRCCCEDKLYFCCRCCLYSWSLQISDDNKTWTEVHRVDNDESFKNGKEKTF